MKLYVVVLGDEFPRGNSYRYRHIRAYESKKRAENYAKTIEGARVAEFIPNAVTEAFVNMKDLKIVEA